MQTLPECWAILEKNDLQFETLNTKSKHIESSLRNVGISISYKMFINHLAF